jgi:hypothetical protein
MACFVLHRTVDKHIHRFKLLSVIEVLPETALEENATPATPALDAHDLGAASSDGAAVDTADARGEDGQALDGAHEQKEADEDQEQSVAEAGRNVRVVGGVELAHTPTPGPALEAPWPTGEAGGGGVGGGGEGGGGGIVGPRAGGWKRKMLVRMVLVFDKPGGVGSQRLTGRVIIRGTCVSYEDDDTYTERLTGGVIIRGTCVSCAEDDTYKERLTGGVIIRGRARRITTSKLL